MIRKERGTVGGVESSREGNTLEEKEGTEKRKMGRKEGTHKQRKRIEGSLEKREGYQEEKMELEAK